MDLEKKQLTFLVNKVKYWTTQLPDEEVRRQVADFLVKNYPPKIIQEEIPQTFLFSLAFREIQILNAREICSYFNLKIFPFSIEASPSNYFLFRFILISPNTGVYVVSHDTPSTHINSRKLFFIELIMSIIRFQRKTEQLN